MIMNLGLPTGIKILYKWTDMLDMKLLWTVRIQHVHVLSLWIAYIIFLHIIQRNGENMQAIIT